MPMKRIFQNEWISRLVDGLLPVFATLAALFVYSLRLRKKQRSALNDKSLAT